MAAADPIKGSSASNKHDFGQVDKNAQHDTGNYQGDFQTQLDDLSDRLDLIIQNHRHDGNSARQVNLNELAGLFEVVSAIPAGIPKGPYDQIKVYENGATHKLYWYDYTNNAWRST